MTGALSVLSAVMSLVVWVLKQRYSAVNIQKRARYERGKALSKGKSKTIGLHLSDLYHRVRQDRRTP